MTTLYLPFRMMMILLLMITMRILPAPLRHPAFGFLMLVLLLFPLSSLALPPTDSGVITFFHLHIHDLPSFTCTSLLVAW